MCDVQFDSEFANKLKMKSYHSTKANLMQHWITLSPLCFYTYGKLWQVPNEICNHILSLLLSNYLSAIIITTTILCFHLGETVIVVRGYL